MRYALSNEKYAGNALLQKKYRNNHIEKRFVLNHGELPQYYVTESHPAIVDEATFEAAQLVLARIAAGKASEKEHVEWETAAGPVEQSTPTEQPTPVDRSSPNLTDLPTPTELPTPKPTDRHIFSRMITCAACGKAYRFVRNHGMPRWACRTYITEGKAACPSKKIPEEIIMRLACDIFGWDSFDEVAFRASVDHITSIYPSTLVFDLKDGRKIPMEWSGQSRAVCWTPEMKEKARALATCSEL